MKRERREEVLPSSGKFTCPYLGVGGGGEGRFTEEVTFDLGLGGSIR